MMMDQNIGLKNRVMLHDQAMELYQTLAENLVHSLWAKVDLPNRISVTQLKVIE